MLKTVILLTCVCAAILSYRMYIVMHREIPPEVENPSVVRWLDEIGRIGNSITWLCHQIGLEHATWPAKPIVNLGARILLNGIGHRISNMTVRYTSVDGVPVTIFLPDAVAAEDKHVTMVYFHGGGWTWLSVDVYSGYLANLATTLGVQIVAPDYRKPPQFPFPAAFEDCLTVTRGLIKRTKDFKIVPDKFVVGGDGAGGNLAAAVAYTVQRNIFIQVLINPALQVLDLQTPSYQDNKNTLPGLSSAFRNVYHWLSYAGISKDYLQLTLENAHVPSSVKNSAFMRFVDSKNYLPSKHGVTTKQTKPHASSNFIVSSAFKDIITDPRYCPMLAFNAADVPKVYMITSQYDVYRDEAIMYTHRLHEAGVKVKLEHHFEAFHGFFLFNGYGPIKFDVSQKALEVLAEFFEITVHERI